MNTLPMNAGGNWIYVASKLVHRDKWIALKRDHKATIISTWIFKPANVNLESVWKDCIHEVCLSNRLVAYREPGEVLKGAFIEIGAALAFDIPVVLLGDFDDFTFTHHPLVSRASSIDEAFNL